MTQNVVTLETPKGPMEICIGWDRPTQEFFCNTLLLGDEDETEDEAEGNGADGFCMPFRFPGGIAQIKQSLIECKLAVPPVVIEKAAHDGELNSGNIYRRFAPDGALLEEVMF